MASPKNHPLYPWLAYGKKLSALSHPAEKGKCVGQFTKRLISLMRLAIRRGDVTVK